MDGTFGAKPGVYVVGNGQTAVGAVCPATKCRNFAIGEYVAPKEGNVENIVLHAPCYAVEAGGRSIKIAAKVIGSTEPDSVVVYPRHISFWNDVNPLYRMKRTGSYDYEAELPIDARDAAVEYKYHSSLCSQQILWQKIRFGHDFGQAGWKKLGKVAVLGINFVGKVAFLPENLLEKWQNLHFLPDNKCFPCRT